MWTTMFARQLSSIPDFRWRKPLHGHQDTDKTRYYMSTLSHFSRHEKSQANFWFTLNFQFLPNIYIYRKEREMNRKNESETTMRWICQNYKHVNYVNEKWPPKGKIINLLFLPSNFKCEFPWQILWQNPDSSSKFWELMRHSTMQFFRSC